MYLIYKLTQGYILAPYCVIIVNSSNLKLWAYLAGAVWRVWCTVTWCQLESRVSGMRWNVVMSEEWLTDSRFIVLRCKFESTDSYMT
jgi:hypothetical protein